MNFHSRLGLAITNAIDFLESLHGDLSSGDVADFNALAGEVVRLAVLVHLDHRLPTRAELYEQMKATNPELTPDYLSALNVPGQRMKHDGGFIAVTRDWSDKMQDLLRLCLSLSLTSPSEPEPAQVPVSRLEIDLLTQTLTLDGTTHDVRSELALRWLKLLADRPGQWLSARELGEIDSELDGCRTDRLRRFFPQVVADLVDSETGRGSRIRLT